MSNYYEWFDPHEKRKDADEAPQKIRDANMAGHANGQRELGQILKSHAFKGLELAAETLGRQMAYHENIQQAVSTVAAGLKQNAEISLKRWERPERMDSVMELKAFIPSFHLNYAVVLEPKDMCRSGW